jgi:hypothetical protein
MKRVETASYPVSIFVAGRDVRPLCQAYCDEIGLCVTVSPTRYVYSGGAGDGWVIGLINYGRFPSEPAEIFAKAEALALRLIGEGIESATIQAPDKTLWLNCRDEGGRRWVPHFDYAGEPMNSGEFRDSGGDPEAPPHP